jgi:hypothetical protein
MSAELALEMLLSPGLYIWGVAYSGDTDSRPLESLSAVAHRQQLLPNRNDAMALGAAVGHEPPLTTRFSCSSEGDTRHVGHPH